MKLLQDLKLEQMQSMEENKRTETGRVRITTVMS